MLVSFLGGVVSIAAAYLTAPADWMRLLFAASVLGWIAAAALYYLGNRR